MAFEVLFFLALAWLTFAVVQDFRTREISNWLTFSLIALALLYRGAYALLYNNYAFFWWGLGGVGLFVSIAYLLYYGRAFAGGDAKLLMGLGGVLPFASFSDYLFTGLGFVLLLFAVGVVYSLTYTVFCVIPRWRAFSKQFGEQFKKLKFFYAGAFAVGIIAGILAGRVDILWGVLFFFGIACLPFVYMYARAVERACFVKLMNPAALTEGDWLVRDVRVGNRILHASVHGLTMKEIALLKRVKKSVWIKQGVPFALAFLIAFLMSEMLV